MKKIVFDFNIFTNGDFNFSYNSDYVSKYFENDLYEYTFFNGYSCRLRRVFDLNELNLLSDFITKLRENTYSDDSSTQNDLDEYFDSIADAYSGIENIINNDEDTNTLYGYSENDDWEGTDFTFSIIDTKAKKIKEIIYED